MAWLGPMGLEKLRYSIFWPVFINRMKGFHRPFIHRFFHLIIFRKAEYTFNGGIMIMVMKTYFHVDMTILLIEHDMKLVSGICETLTVLSWANTLLPSGTCAIPLETILYPGTFVISSPSNRIVPAFYRWQGLCTGNRENRPGRRCEWPFEWWFN